MWSPCAVKVSDDKQDKQWNAKNHKSIIVKCLHDIQVQQTMDGSLRAASRTLPTRQHLKRTFGEPCMVGWIVTVVDIDS